jgi:small subunit ribosomal protein S17
MDNQQKPTTGDERGSRRKLIGVVTSDKMDKTVVVSVSRRVLNPRFGKYETKRAKYKAHSERNDVHVGDRVLLVEARPMSKDKRWRVQELLEKARQA